MTSAKNLPENWELLLAASEGDGDAVRDAYRRCGGLELRDRLGRTPLIRAVGSGTTSAITELLSLGANPYVVTAPAEDPHGRRQFTRERGMHLFHYIASRGSTVTLEAVLEGAPGINIAWFNARRRFHSVNGVVELAIAEGESPSLAGALADMGFEIADSILSREEVLAARERNSEYLDDEALEWSLPLEHRNEGPYRGFLEARAFDIRRAQRHQGKAREGRWREGSDMGL